MAVLLAGSSSRFDFLSIVYGHRGWHRAPFITKGSAQSRTLGFASILGAVIIGPVIETVLLSYMLTLLTSTSLSRLSIILIAGVVWGLIHGAFGSLWFFGTFWSFMMFSNAYLTWRAHSWRQAFAAACLPHMTINALAFIFLLLLSR